MPWGEGDRDSAESESGVSVSLRDGYLVPWWWEGILDRAMSVETRECPVKVAMVFGNINRTC